MQITELSIAGSWLFTPKIHGDDRGAFLEWYKSDPFQQAVGQELDLKQANCSVSAKGVVRGIHFADVPPSQAKYVTCVSGEILDVVVDIRVGSPTFGKWEGVRLDSRRRQALYLSEGLGHGFASLVDGTTVVYLCSEAYNPSREHGVHPLDPDLGIDWGEGIEPSLSPKDAQAPSLAQALAEGLLPSMADCEQYYRSLRG